MLEYPSFNDLIQQGRAEMQVQLPGVDPTVSGSWAKSFIDSGSVLAQILTFLIRDLEKQLFPQTANGDFLGLWGQYEGLERLAPASSEGLVTLEGITGTVIPGLTNFTGANGLEYETQTVATIVDRTQSIITLVRAGSTAYALCSDDHNLANGTTVTVSGATQPEYNTTAQVVVTNTRSFSYPIVGTPSFIASGTIVWSGAFASIPIEAIGTGAGTNIEAGGQVSNDTFGTAIVQADGLSGGSGEESDDDYRERILLSRSSIAGVFTPTQIELAAKSIAGNSKVFVKKPTLSTCSGTFGTYVNPVPGQVSVFLVRNDSEVTQTIIDRTKQAIIDNAALPAEMSELDLFVQAPDEVTSNFVFTDISPDTPTMRTAITEQIEAYFADVVKFETDVTETDYTCMINATQSVETGEIIESFTMSSPSGDIVVGDGEIAVIGGVSFV